jgi:RNA polymerase sigma-70 factor (ECF subfamily)
MQIDAIDGDRVPDERLVSAARSGDEGAFRQLVERHQDRVYSVTLRLLRDRDVALEAAQDVFLRAWKALDRFEQRSRLSTWLHRIAVNVCYDRLGRKKRAGEIPLEELIEEGLEPASGVGSAADAPVENRQATAAFEAAVAGLGEMYRVVFILRQVEGRPYEEIAGALGISVTNAKVRVHRARDMLVEALKKQGVL